MSEIRREVKTYEVTYACDDCETTNSIHDCKVQSTGVVLDSNPPQYEHKCMKCEKVYLFTSCYPGMIHQYS